MEERPEELAAIVEQDRENQPIQDLNHDGSISNTESLNPEQESSSKVDKLVSDQSNKDLGNYGPWMLVNKQPRKRALGKNKDSSQSKAPHRDNLMQGSRFDLLKEDEVQEIVNLQGGQNSVSSQSIPHEGHHGQVSSPTIADKSKVICIRDPKAGKNSQQNQEKRK
ncbi:hypothetical protein SESBI_20410 [Sesbania bispinosa]|nr:hypothetical protein SESBI_20410 [Sesbania bispinosa]